MEKAEKKYAVIELKYDEGKVVIARHKWILNRKKLYNKTDDEFCYWSNNLEDSVEDMKCEYSQKFTGEPALFKAFIIKLTDSIEEAEQCLQGRLKFVSKKFREPGNTDVELKQMESKRKRSEKKVLKSHKAEAQTVNSSYLINEVALQESKEKVVNVVDEEEIGEPKPKKKRNIKSSELSENDKRKKKDRSNGQKYKSSYRETQLQAKIASTDELDEGKVKDYPGSVNENDKSSPNKNKHAQKKKEYSQLNKSKGQKNAVVIEPLINMTTHQPLSPSPEPKQVPSEEINVSRGKFELPKSLSSSSEIYSSNHPSPLCELPSTSFGFSFDELVHSLWDGSVGAEGAHATANIAGNSNTSTDSDIMVSDEINLSGEQFEQAKCIFSSEKNLLQNQPSPLCEVASPSFGFAFDNSVVQENLVEVPLVNDKLTPQINYTSDENRDNCSIDTYQADPCTSGANIIVLNFDELTAKYNDAISEVMNLKSENESLKADLLKADRRNKLLQDYLIAVDERVPEILFVEKDGGRLYRDNVFLTKDQCAVLDKAKTDNEYINNLLICIFGRDVLKTHTLFGKRSKKSEEMNVPSPSAQALDKTRLSLIYEIMDARAVANKTKKLSKGKINAVITKKISNITSYKRKS